VSDASTSSNEQLSRLARSNDYLGKDRDQLREIILDRDEEIERLTLQLEVPSNRATTMNNQSSETNIPEINTLLSSFQTRLIMDELKGGQEDKVNAARDALLSAVQAVIEERNRLRRQISRLCDQIERCDPVDAQEHRFTMNAEYIAARAVTS
jgi:hypothetical protein